MAPEQSPAAVHLTRERIRAACDPTPWDFGNEILYGMFSENPRHSDYRVVIAKVLILGRTYAAAVERRTPRESDLLNQNYYVERVAPEIMDSDIDQWIAQATEVAPSSQFGLETMVRLHHEMTRLFHKISGQNKRSLASKYLHFHVPKLFYIYDNRARTGLKMLGPSVVGRPSQNDLAGETEYRRFAEKCHNLQLLCTERFGVSLSPRQLDNLLLGLL
jgi:hypothetical protein